MLVGLRKQLISNFVFPTWACAAGLIIIKIIIIIIIPRFRVCFAPRTLSGVRSLAQYATGLIN